MRTKHGHHIPGTPAEKIPQVIPECGVIPCAECISDIEREDAIQNDVVSMAHLFESAEDKGRLTAKEFLDKLRTDYEWHVISGSSVSGEPFELYIGEPEGFFHFLPPYFVDMPIHEVQEFFEEFNRLTNPGSNRFMLKSRQEETEGGSGTPQS